MTELTATGEVQMNEDVQVFVHDFDLFVTVRLLRCVYKISPFSGYYLV